MVKKVRGTIRDGYTEQGYLMEIERLYPELRFEFRPMLITQVLEWTEGLEKLKTAVEKRRLTASYMADHVVSWDLVDDKDKLVPIEPEDCLTIKPALFNRLFSVLCGDEPYDEDPRKSDTELSEELKRRLAATGGKGEQIDTKNS